MQTYAGNLKNGEFIRHQDGIWQIVKAEFYSPGKGSALMRAKMKNVGSGKTNDYTFKSQESVETMDVNSMEMQYLYKDAESLYFMNEQTFEQMEVPLAMAEGFSQFLKEGDKMYVYVLDDKALSVRPPSSLRLKITQTEDAARGDTVGNVKKPATVETGATVMVPAFIKAGDIITINPETAEYTGRENS